MKINEVEQKVGITKKNIRFYEEQGLIHPKRNRNNGYRNYSEEDVQELYKIKLLRMLSIPIKVIHQVQTGEISLDQCMEDHMLYLTHERRNLEKLQNMCERVKDQHSDYVSIDAVSYLEHMRQIEEGGTTFMNVQNTDRTKRKVGPWIAALAMTLIMAAFMAIIIFAAMTDPLPLALFILLMCIPGAVIIGTFIALYQRIREIEGGEEDEAVKY